jgi:hypothetical protein
MFKAIKSLLKNFQDPKVYVDLSIDHIELAEDYLMLGLNFAWHNQTPNPITVREVQIKFFNQGRLDEPILFRPQGHFTRVPGQKVITKVIGAKSFLLPPGKSHEEGIRFFTRAILNLDEGTYPVEIHATVPGGTYVHRADVQITNRIKYRTSEAWTAAMEEPVI